MVLAYAIVGAIVFNTMLALGEMAAFMPIAGVSHEIVALTPNADVNTD